MDSGTTVSDLERLGTDGGTTGSDLDVLKMLGTPLVGPGKELARFPF